MLADLNRGKITKLCCGLDWMKMTVMRRAKFHLTQTRRVTGSLSTWLCLLSAFHSWLLNSWDPHLLQFKRPTFSLQCRAPAACLFHFRPVPQQGTGSSWKWCEHQHELPRLSTTPGLLYTTLSSGSSFPHLRPPGTVHLRLCSSRSAKAARPASEMKSKLSAKKADNGREFSSPIALVLLRHAIVNQIS